MNETCGCCDGIQQVTPITIANRPGLDALRYRVGTHASFLETMLARLSSMSLRLGDLDTILPNPDDKDKLIYPLQGLTTRSPNDPAIAFLDAWAIVADVLTFYQERIANEGYLRTATERRSILELARLVGYSLRPGVAASVYLAYTLEKDHDVVIQPDNRAQSIPGPGELPQSFETAEKLEARFAWNALKARLTRPQYMKMIVNANVTVLQTRTNEKDHPIYFQGTATNLKSGAPLLFLVGNNRVFTHIVTVETQTAANRTRVTVNPPPTLLGLATTHQSLKIREGEEPSFGDIIRKLKLPPSLQPRNTQRLERTVSQAFTQQSDIHPQLLVNFSPILQSTLYRAIVNMPTTTSPPKLPEVQALRVKAAPFGHNAPLKPILNNNGVAVDHEEWALGDTTAISVIVSFDGHSPYKVVVSIGQGRNLWSQSVSLSREGVDVPAAPATSRVHISFAGAADNHSISLNFLESREQIQITEEQSEWGIQINNDQKFVLSPQQKQHYSTSQHRIDAEFTDNTVSISDAVSLPVTNRNVLPLDAQYDKIIQTHENLDSWVVIERPGRNDPTQTEQIITRVKKVETVSIAAYGITGRVTQLTLEGDWLFDKDTSLSVIRNTTVYAQSEKRALAEEPIEEVIGTTQAGTSTNLKVGTNVIELDKIYDGLKSSQRLIISGERTDVISAGVAVSGIRASELIMLQSVTQEVQKIPEDGNKDLPGDQKHTFLHLAKPLAYTYKRDTVTIYANVVRATHGETHNEVLGSGDGSKALQQFPLRQSPLTYVSAATPSGIDTTLQVRVNDLLWHEVDSLVDLTPASRKYVTETDDAHKTKVICGNGVYGARLPTGIENVKARYRTGIGKAGNVQAEQISLLSTKPLGVKAVINPLRASGGANPESRDQARRNVPIALLALDRLVSVQDYEDFARCYAGIGKASAVSLSNGNIQLVNLTIVGLDNIPIDITSDLYLNLLQSLRQFGDPHQPLHIDLAEVLFLVISAKVRLLPDYQLESVEPKIRDKLLDTFSFDRRQLGQPVFQSEVFSVIQGIIGVDYVDLEVMGAVG